MKDKFEQIQEWIKENRSTTAIGEQIQEWLTSEDKSVLEQSLKIIDEHLNKEIERGESITKRISIMITLLAAGTAVLIFFGKTILEISSNFPFLIYFMYSVPVIFLIKTFFYSLRAIRPGVKNITVPQLIFDIQDKTFLDSLRYETTWKIWEYFQILPFNAGRLFLFERGLSNFLFSIISFLILGLLLLLNKNSALHICNKIQFTIGGFFILFAFLIDYILKKTGFWKIK